MGLTNGSGSPQSFIYVLKGDDGSLVWQSPATSPNWASAAEIHLADVDGNGVTDIIYYGVYEGLHVINGVSHVEKWFLADPEIWALDVGDVDNDGDLDMITGDGFGYLRAYDGKTKAQLFTNKRLGGILGIKIADVDGDGTNEILISEGAGSGWHDITVVKVLKASDRSLLWKSPNLPGEAGTLGTLRVVDADDDGNKEIAVATALDLRFFEYTPATADTQPPSFDGAVGVQAVTPVSSTGCCPAVEVEWADATDAASAPVAYRVYRATQSGFTPDPANLAAETKLTSYRDPDVAAATLYYYVVRAVDLQGNEDSNLVELAVMTSAPTADQVPPDQGNVLRATKATGDLSLSYAGAPASVWRVYRDPNKASIGATPLSPDLEATSFLDAGAIGASAPLHYVVKGLSPCSRSAGP